MPTSNYNIPDTTPMRDAEEAAKIYREMQGDHPPVAQLAAHIDVLLAELRDMRQAHARSIESYHALRDRVRDALAVDDFA